MNSIIENFFDLHVAAESWHLLQSGLLALIKLVAVSSAVAVVVGTLLLRLRQSSTAWISRGQVWFIDAVRAIPPLVLLVVVYYLMPPLGPISIDTFWAAVVTFGIVQGAYVSEILRGGLAAIPVGQYEASAALGLRPLLMSRFVIAPQVLKVVIPPMTSQATQLVRDASLTFFIGYEEIVTRSKQAVSLTSNSTPYTVALLIYLVILLSMQFVSRRLERREHRGRMGTDVLQRA